MTKREFLRKLSNFAGVIDDTLVAHCKSQLVKYNKRIANVKEEDAEMYAEFMSSCKVFIEAIHKAQERFK